LTARLPNGFNRKQQQLKTQRFELENLGSIYCTFTAQLIKPFIYNGAGGGNRALVSSVSSNLDEGWFSPFPIINYHSNAIAHSLHLKAVSNLQMTSELLESHSILCFAEGTFYECQSPSIR
jgi:hypothetical protein